MLSVRSIVKYILFSMFILHTLLTPMDSTAYQSWTSLEVITADNITRLVNLHSLDLGDGVISRIVSRESGANLFLSIVFDSDQLHLVQANETNISSQILKSYTKPIADIAFDPLSTFLGVSTYEQGVELWDLFTNEIVMTIETDRVFSSIQFDSQSSRLFLGGGDEIREWDLVTSSRTRTFVMPNVSVKDISLSPAGDLIAIGHQSGLSLVDWTNQQELPTYITSISNQTTKFSDNAAILAYMSESGYEIGLWNMTLDQLIILKEDELFPYNNDISFMSNGDLFSIATSNRIEIYDSVRGNPLVTFDISVTEITALTFSSGGKHLITGHADGNVNIWGVFQEGATATSSPQLPHIPDGVTN